MTRRKLIESTYAGYEVHIDEPEEDGDDVPGEG